MHAYYWIPEPFILIEMLPDYLVLSFHKHVVLYLDAPCSLISLLCLHQTHTVCSSFLTHLLNFDRSDVSWILLLVSVLRDLSETGVWLHWLLWMIWTPVSVSWGHNLFLLLAANVVGWWRKWIKAIFLAPESRIEMIANLHSSSCWFPAFLPSGNTSKNNSISRVCWVSGWVLLRSQPTGQGSGWPGPLAEPEGLSACYPCIMGGMSWGRADLG